MKIAFGMPFKNEEEMLRKNLPKLPAMFDQYIFLDTGTTDKSREIILSCLPDALFFEDKIDYLDFGRWRSRIVKEAENLGHDWLFFLDADETIFEEDLETIFTYIEKGKDTLYRLARIELVLDNNHYRVDVFPDWQGRVLKLNMGYYYSPQTHAIPHKDGKPAAGQFLPQCTIYHYGWTTKFNEKMKHYHPDIKESDWENVIKTELFFGRQP